MIFFAETTPQTDAGLMIQKFHDLADEIGQVVVHRLARDYGAPDCLIIGTLESGEKLEKLTIRLAQYSGLDNGRLNFTTNDVTEFVEATNRAQRPISHLSLKAAYDRVVRDLT